MKEVSEADRELTRSLLVSRTEELRRRYKMSLAEIRQHLREMISVSV